MHNIARIRYTVNDLLSMLRLKDIFQLSEVEYAIVEPSGHLSVLKKAESMPPAAKDLGVAVAAKGLPMLLIVDGRLITNTLEQIELTRQWLDSQLLHQGHRDIKEVYLAALEADGTVYIAGKKQTDTGKSMHY